MMTGRLQEEEDENAEADADMEEGKLQWAGGRREEATYDAGEAEDVALQAANEPPEVRAHPAVDHGRDSHRCWASLMVGTPGTASVSTPCWTGRQVSSCVHCMVGASCCRLAFQHVQANCPMVPIHGRTAA